MCLCRWAVQEPGKVCYKSGAFPKEPSRVEHRLPSQATLELDPLVIGAGFGGMYALHVLREAGLKVHAYDEATGAGARDTGIDFRGAGRVPRRPLLFIYVLRRTRARVRLAGAIARSGNGVQIR